MTLFRTRYPQPAFYLTNLIHQVDRNHFHHSSISPRSSWRQYLGRNLHIGEYSSHLDSHVHQGLKSGMDPLHKLLAGCWCMSVLNKDVFLFFGLNRSSYAEVHVDNFYDLRERGSTIMFFLLRSFLQFQRLPYLKLRRDGTRRISPRGLTAKDGSWRSRKGKAPVANHLEPTNNRAFPPVHCSLGGFKNNQSN